MRIYLLFLLLITGSLLQAQDTLTIRVLTYNIYHGATMKGDFNLDTIAARIAYHEPDLVALQEVDRLTNRAKKMDLVTELGFRTKMAPMFGRAMYYDSGEYGEGILSAHSFVSSHNHALPHLPNHEPRSALETLVVFPTGDTILFVGTHFEHTRQAPDRTEQAADLALRYAGSRYPVILAGDLNDTPDSEAMQKLFLTFSPTDPSGQPTYPSDQPRKKIDYILTDQVHNWEVVQTLVIPDLVVSDHCGYLAVIRLIKNP